MIIIEERKFNTSFLKAFLFCILWLAVPIVLMYIIVAYLGLYTGGTSFYALDALLENSIVSVVVSFLGVLMTIILITRNDWAQLKIRFWGKSNLFYLFGTILFAIGLNILVSELDNVFRTFIPMSDYWQIAFGELNSLPWYLYILEVVITAPIVEELFMRGVIARGLSNRYSKPKAIFFTAILFGFIHLNIWQFATAFVGGLFLTWLYLTTGSLFLAIFAHALHNGLSLVGELLGWYIPGYNMAGIGYLSHQPWWFDLLGVILILCAIIIFSVGSKRNKQKQEEQHGYIDEFRYQQYSSERYTEQ